MKKTNSKYLWIFVSDETLIATRFKGSNGHTKVTHSNATKLAPGTISEGRVLNNESLKIGLQQLLEGQKTKGVKAILIFSEKLVFHHQIELSEEKDIELEQIRVMAQELFPIDLSTTYNDALVGKKYVEFVAIPKSILGAYLEATDELGLEIVKADAAWEFCEVKDSPINLLPTERLQNLKQAKTMPRVAIVIILIFGYLTYNLLVSAVRWSNDYSEYIKSQKNLLGIQNIVDTVYSKDIALAHFEKVQLSNQIESITETRLVSSAFIETVENIADRFVSLREIKVLHQTEGELPTVRVSALSDGRDQTEAFSKALEASPLFDEVDLPLSFFSKRGEALIEVTLTLNEEAYNKLKSSAVRRKPTLPKRPDKKYFN